MGTLSEPGDAPTVEEIGWFVVDGPVTASIARRATVHAAQRLGLREARVAELAIVAAEITSNLHKHAEEGVMYVRCLRWDGAGGMELVALDRGPGMVDTQLSGRDRHSTAGTLGIGLGAIARLASQWDLYSQPGHGTVLSARFWPRDPASRLSEAATWQRTRPDADGLTRPMAGEEVSGDRYAIRATDGGQLLLVSDGLGHGALAANASIAAVDAFLTGKADDPASMVLRLHQRLGHTRGAAVGVAAVNRVAGSVRFAGLGNISAHVVAPGERRSMVSLPGIVGQNCRNVREFSYPLPSDGLVVMHSDGVRDRWDLDDYPGLTTHEPLVVAAMLLRDAGVRRDDASVLVAMGTAHSATATPTPTATATATATGRSGVGP